MISKQTSITLLVLICLFTISLSQPQWLKLKLNNDKELYVLNKCLGNDSKLDVEFHGRFASSFKFFILNLDNPEVSYYFKDQLTYQDIEILKEGRNVSLFYSSYGNFAEKAFDFEASDTVVFGYTLIDENPSIPSINYHEREECHFDLNNAYELIQIAVEKSVPVNFRKK